VLLPVEVIPGREALEIAGRNNAFRKWPKDRNAKNRVTPFAAPGFKPTFELEPGETVYTIGSCFARNIEENLEALGFGIAAQKMLDDATVAENGATPWMLNKYTPHSILNEFRWALEPESYPFPDPDGFFEMGPDRWRDGHMHAQDQRPLSVVRGRRKAALENAKLVKDCRVVVITPGVGEVWWDEQARCYLNEAPPIRFLRKNPDRFALHVLEYEQAVDVFEEIHAILSRHLDPDFQILFTISPVPLISTFRELDVMVANTYSKAVLRAAAEVFCTRHDNVDYFPSYESVTYTSPRIAIDPDLIHVTPKAVRAIVERMIEAYAPSSIGFEKSVTWGRDIEEASYPLYSKAKSRIVTLEQRVRVLEAEQLALQTIIEVTKKQLERSQQTTAQYLRQVLERDGVLDAPS